MSVKLLLGVATVAVSLLTGTVVAQADSLATLYYGSDVWEIDWARVTIAAKDESNPCHGIALLMLALRDGRYIARTPTSRSAITEEPK